MIKASKNIFTRFFYFILIDYFELIYKKYHVRKSVKIGKKKYIYLKSMKTKKTFTYLPDFGSICESLFRI